MISDYNVLTTVPVCGMLEYRLVMVGGSKLKEEKSLWY